MRSTLTLILDPLIGMYALCFAMRLAMQWVRADFRNPIVHFVLTVTNPLVLPLRRFVPPVYKIDTATLIIYILMGWAAMTVLTALECFIKPDVFTTLLLGCFYCVRLLLSAYSFIIIGYVILSWNRPGWRLTTRQLMMISAALLGAAGHCPSCGLFRKLFHRLPGWTCHRYSC